jgi:hypothetical protein
VSDYRLDDQGLISTEAKDIFNSVFRPAQRPTLPPIRWVLRVFTRGGKAWSGRDTDHSPYLLLRSRMSSSYTPLPIGTCMVEAGQLFFYITKRIHLLLCSNVYHYSTTLFGAVDPWQGQRIFPLASVSRPALGPTQPPVQWVPGVLSPGVKHGRGVMLTTHPHLVPRS